MRALLLLCCVFGVATPAFAQAAIALTMVASETTVARGDTFRLDVVLTVNGQDAVDELELPDLTDFTVLRENESQQASFSTRNGRRAVTVEHRRSYLLRAIKSGKLTIAGATATLGNDVARAQPIVITVSGKAVVDDDNANQNNGGDKNNGVDAGSEAAVTGSAEPGARFTSGLPQIFLELRTDRTEAWVGEQITVVGEIWSRVPLGSWPRVPGLKPPGFVCLSVDDGVRPQAVQRRLRGQVFNVYPVTRDALFALSPGTKTLPPIEIEVTPAGSFFQRQDVRVRSGSLDLEIKPLPEPAPPGFVAGAVGAFEIRTSIKPQRTTVGVPVTVVVEITGVGNIDEVPLPVWGVGPANRTFPATVRRDRKDRDGLISGQITQETLVQPSAPGTLTVPSITWVVFDTNLDRYVTKQTTPVSIVVVEDADGPRPGNSARSSTRSAIAAGTRPLALDIELRDHALLAPAPAIGAGVFVAGIVVGLIGRRRRRRIDSDHGQRLRRREKRRVDAEAIRTTGDVAAAQRLLIDAVSERCGDDIRAVDANALPAVLVARGLNEPLANQIAAAILGAEAARFAPGGQKQQAIQQALQTAAAVDAGVVDVDPADAARGAR